MVSFGSGMRGSRNLNGSQRTLSHIGSQKSRSERLNTPSNRHRWRKRLSGLRLPSALRRFGSAPTNVTYIRTWKKRVLRPTVYVKAYPTHLEPNRTALSSQATTETSISRRFSTSVLTVTSDIYGALRQKAPSLWSAVTGWIQARSSTMQKVMRLLRAILRRLKNL